MGLTDQNMRIALGAVPAYIHHRRKDFRITVVGGAVSIMLLKARAATHDVDYIASSLSQSDVRIREEATGHVQRTYPQLQLEGNWFNRNATLFIDPAVRSKLIQELFQQGLAQNEIVFDAPGLRLYAAPWEWAICAKLDRIAGGG